MSHTHPVQYEQDGGGVVLTLNEPTTRNAISPAIVEALVESTARINADLSVGCVIITGAGTVSRHARLTRVVIDHGCQIPEGMVIGEDPAADARRFERTEKGITLVTRKMLARLI